MSQVKSHLDGWCIVLMVFLCASWGLQQVSVKLALGDMAPVWQAAVRSVGATVLVWLWIVLRRRPLFEKDGTLYWGIGAGLLFAAEFLLLYWGLEFTNASRAVIFLYTSPFVVAIGMQLFVPSEKLTRLQYIGLASSFVGILVAFGESLTLPSTEMLIGDLMLIGAAILWGATTVTIKAGALATVSPSKTLFYQLAVSAVILPVGAWVLEGPLTFNATPVLMGSLLYQTVWIATITYICWFWLIRHYPAPKLASFSFMTPLFGVLAGGLILDEPLTPALLVAMVFVAVGIYLVNKRK